MARQLSDSVIVITGASAGIGAALARAAHATGARLVLAARRLDRLELLNSELGGDHLCVVADVAKPADCEALVARTIEHFGRLDTLVCNAGYGLVRQIAETGDAEHLAMFQTNVIGTTACIRAAVPHLRANAVRDEWRGQIMIVSSSAARRGMPYFGAYSATKAAQLSIAEALRVELADARIAVTSVHPVGTDTEFFSSADAISHAGADRPGGGAFRQTADQVAAAMIRAMRQPRPELWPVGPSRVKMLVAAMLPRAADRMMHRAFRGIAADHAARGLA